MKPLALLLPLLLLAGCQTDGRPYSPVENVRYTALGEDPFWMVTIGDDRIVLTFGPDPGAAPGELRSHEFPRTLPRTIDGVRRWESGQGTAVISIEAADGPCEASGRRYEDRVTVRLSGRELQGCGGRAAEGSDTGGMR
jgi:uncharacterized membrane protein